MIRVKVRSYLTIDRGIAWFLLCCASVSILVTFLILYILGSESFHFFRQVSFFDFISGTNWSPMIEPKSFGVLPLVMGTFHVVVISGVIGIPVGLLIAIYLSEFSNKRTRSIIKPFLELLAGIPSLVYGYFAFTFITPILQIVFPSTEIFNSLSAGIVLAIMILPMMASLCDDAFQAVPRSLKEGGYAMGATSLEVIKSIVVPTTSGRVFSAFLLAISRAIGETMAVTLAAGANPQMTFSPLTSVQTMTAYIVQISMGDTPTGSIEYLTSFAVALLLFFFTYSLNMIGQRVLRRSYK